VFTLTLELSEEETRTLREAAEREGTTLEEAARTAMMRGAAEPPKPERVPDANFASYGIFAGDGTSIADVEDELMQGFGED
jgi:hypothetical protein